MHLILTTRDERPREIVSPGAFYVIHSRRLRSKTDTDPSIGNLNQLHPQLNLTRSRIGT